MTNVRKLLVSLSYFRFEFRISKYLLFHLHTPKKIQNKIFKNRQKTK